MSIKVLRRSPWRDVEPGIEPVPDVETLVEVADHLAIALPATPATARLINATVLGRARKSLHIVNIARGKIIDHEALLRALDSGQIAGATLDVTDPERCPRAIRFTVTQKLFSRRIFHGPAGSVASALRTRRWQTSTLTRMARRFRMCSTGILGIRKGNT